MGLRACGGASDVGAAAQFARLPEQEGAKAHKLNRPKRVIP